MTGIIKTDQIQGAQSSTVTIPSGTALNVTTVSGTPTFSGNVSMSGTAAISGNTTVGGTLVNTGLITASAGVAIGGTGSANTLDDYEEGSWTPNCGTPGVSGSYSVQLGRYVKIGDFCHLIFNLTISGAYTGSTSSSFTIGGLPFATKAYDGSLYAGGHIGYYFNINHTDTGRTLVYQIPSGSSLTMELKGVGDNIGEQLVSPAMMGTNAVIRGSISYHTA